MTLNQAIFAKNPLETKLPNEGVAKIGEPRTVQEWDVLRYELMTFVCEGEYKAGMDRILSSYTANLGEAQQPAVWVSGFFGSGKSHFVRMLEFLWRDVEFPDDKARARGLAKLPSEIAAHFQELSIAGRREGGLWSAAGTLGAGAGESVRLAMLGIIFRCAGLPEQYPAAQFAIWLKQYGYYDAVRQGIEAEGKTFETELRSMYVSPVLAKNLLAACPGFADTELAARQLLKAQYPTVADISDADMVATMGEVLALKSSTPGKLPCTLIVFDELQQYVGENADRTLRVQNVVEACTAKFGSRVLFVATGQDSLIARAALSKLQGRFTILVSLSDKDVETVVREVVLRKKPDCEPDVRKILSDCSGEIDRHLAATKIAPSGADTPEIMVADYPLLPVRRRFWADVLRAADNAGVAGQLRTQLRVVHEAVREVADKPLGTVVAADRIYKQLILPMRQAKTLLREVEQTIGEQDDGTEDGRLRSRLCATLFLIRQLPRDGGADIGIRANADTLADLLVEDLQAGSASLRKRVPALLQDMVGTGKLMIVDGEYLLQTREGAAWELDFRNRQARLVDDDIRIANDRTQELKTVCSKLLKDIATNQGVTKTPRKVELFFADAPSGETGAVPIWIRDEWSVADKTVREEAQSAGADSPIVFVFLPRRNADDLRRALAGSAAATETLQTRGTPMPASQEGLEAYKGMETRQAEQQNQVRMYIDNVLRDAKVYQGGGNEIAVGDLRASCVDAMQSSLGRLFPNFSMGDNPKWDRVKDRARQGNMDALSVLPYTGEANQNPVCQQVMTYVGTAGKKGIDIRERFMSSPYGWPRDAVEGALLALVAAGQMRALQNGTEIPASQIDNAKVGQTEFQVVNVTVPTMKRLAVRGLIANAGIPIKNGEEATASPRYVEAMIALALSAGGAAPLPAPPNVDHLTAIKSLSGNELLIAIYDQKDRLAQEFTDWTARKQEVAQRSPRWETLRRLLDHAKSLPIHETVAPQVQAIWDNRALLATPDPVPPLGQMLANELRVQVQAARDKHLNAYTEKIGDLEDDAQWQQLSAPDQKQIRAAHGLVPLDLLKVGTDAELLATLDGTALSEWENKTAAIAERIKKALLEATRRLAPKAERVTLPSATLKNKADVDSYLDKVRTAIMSYIDQDRPVVI